MNDLYAYAIAVGTLTGQIKQIRISYEHNNPDLGERLERLFSAAEEINAALNAASTATAPVCCAPSSRTT